MTNTELNKESVKGMDDMMEWAERQNTTACNCIGRQNGQPACPCQMRSVTVENGRYVRRVDLGPAPSPADRQGFEPFELTERS